jgi:ABC-type antimicrobial peptide transport system permease subunit
LPIRHCAWKTEDWRVGMSETFFPVNDLLRRKRQTILALISLTTCVASTLFLLLFAEHVGFGITSSAEKTLTLGYSAIFSSFLLFVGILIFAVGAVIVSFIAFLMMVQRTRDFGLIKAAGCPNGLIFGYFLTELLIVLFTGCALGVSVGYLTDYAVINMGAFQLYPKALNFWYAPLVFVTFFVFGLIFGLKPLLNAARMSPIVALSPTHYFGLSVGNRFKALSKSRLRLKIASRSLFRRQSATVRIVVFLSTVFVLLTVSITGGIIANDTTTSRVEQAVGKDVILVAYKDMVNQYISLLSKFSGAKEQTDFTYLDPNFAISDAALQQLNSISGVAAFETRLVCEGHMQELMNFTFNPNTLETIPVGDHRETDTLIVGVDAEKVLSSWFIDGRFLRDENSSEAVVGDSVAAAMFEAPLSQSFRMQNSTFNIVGMCLDPLNNGFVTFVSLEKLESLTMFPSPNIVLVQLSPEVDRSSVITQLRDRLANVDQDLMAVELNGTLQENVGFLGALWSVVMFLPLFSLIAATLCLIAYLVLVIDEQHKEFAVLRAMGAKSKTVVSILAVQSLIVLFSSFAVGISFGVIITLMILISHPVVTSFTILEISAWLFAALAGLFLFSLYPAVRFSKKPILQMMS